MAELVTDYLEGVLPTRLWIGARIHLLRCDACTRYFEQMRRTIGLLRRAPVSPPPPLAEETILRRIADGVPRRDGGSVPRQDGDGIPRRPGDDPPPSG